ncbi:MAG: hypothetical protein A4E40_00209 [Methanoregulaceae archaeon PtaU1.Bin059]|nr:MAG: hypothetical protein A4E40_00209 [Methanoregulaceae archaeon PtaU1.Bin059]
MRRIVLDEELLQELLALVEDKLLLVDKGAPVDIEEHEVDTPLVRQEVDDVLVCLCLPCHVLPAGEVFKCLDLVAEEKRPLVLVGPRSLFHLFFQCPDDLGSIPLQDKGGLTNKRGILFFSNLSLAGSTAGTD